MFLQKAYEFIHSCRDQEQYYFDESATGPFFTEKLINSENAIACMSDAMENINAATSKLKESILE